MALQSARALILPQMGEVMLDGLERGEVAVAYQGERFVVEMSEAARRGWYLVNTQREE